MTDYEQFLSSKKFARTACGFELTWCPDSAFPFQRLLAEWSLRLGKGAIFADCGLGKSLLEAVYAENVYRHTNKNILITTPLAVAPQMVREGEKFGVEIKQVRNGVVKRGINVTNYEQLVHYDPKDFVCLVCDESGILKHYAGKLRRRITDFCHRVPYCLLATATPAPNDWEELGNSSEALGGLTRNSMLRAFFIADEDPIGNIESTHHWRLKPHAQTAYWRWVSSWARALRKPSDLDASFSDEQYILPPLNLTQHVVSSKHGEGFLPEIARGLKDQRQARRETLRERCRKVAETIPQDRPCIVWCDLNVEGDLLERIIPGAVQIAGKDEDEAKEERLTAFVKGQVRVLVTKAKIVGFGLNLQHCSDMSYFPTHSHESFYQAIRRCWRFGQKREVNVHLVFSEAERLVLSNMLRKERQANELFSNIVENMNYKEDKKIIEQGNGTVEIPAWLKH